MSSFPNQGNYNNYPSGGRGGFKNQRGGFGRGRGGDQGSGRGRGHSDYRPRRDDRNKPQGNQKLCKFFQQGICNKPNCGFVHKYSYNDSITGVQRFTVNAPIASAVVINEEQIAVALVNGSIKIINVYTGSQVLEFPVSGQIQKLYYTANIVINNMPQNFNYLLFGGVSQDGSQLLGGINTQSGNPELFPQGHAGGITDITESCGLIFTGSLDCSVGVWYYNGTQYNFGTLIRPDPSIINQNFITSVKVIGETLLAATNLGYVIGWTYDFKQNSASYLGVLDPIHNGTANCLITFDRYVLSGGQDGRVLCWDSENNFSGWELANTGKARSEISSLLIMSNLRNELHLLLGDANGKIHIFALQGTEAKYISPVHLFKQRVTSLSSYINNSQRISGFVSTSMDQAAAIMQWIK
ncbi:unnamed protein product [Blepharisma stoltei]|uniref:C3H1-type domain-containing protein n=1 Tax=Blepharisma stoltei TaxID=1481888 RepID=A0AAU9JYK6_9CILI|nr:unnamed protein product [Blepharisma stoltei]